MKKKYSKKILILGAGISHIPMIRTAKKMGLYTIVMDKDKNALGFKFCHKKIVLDASDKELVLQEAQEEKVKDLEAKLKAQQEKDNDEKSHEARKGRYGKLFANTNDEER